MGSEKYFKKNPEIKKKLSVAGIPFISESVANSQIKFISEYNFGTCAFKIT
jgi:hypothetical protein